MKEKKSGSSLLRTLTITALMAPALRLLPGRSAQLAGSACWLSVLAAAPALVLTAWFLSEFLKNRGPGEGLAELLRRALGGAGGAVTVLLSLWLLFYCGFILRSGADRFVATVYPGASPLFFSVAMTLSVLPAILGPIKTLMRAARLFWPVVAAVLGTLIVLALAQADYSKLLPVTFADTVPILSGAVPVIEVTATVMTLACFLESGSKKEPGRFGSWVRWLIAPLVILLALIAAVIGSFGAELTARLSYPFFALTRAMRVFGSVEHFEALAAAVWVLPDYVLVSALLAAASRTLMTALGYVRPSREPKLYDMKNGRVIIPLCAAGALLVSAFIAPDAKSLKFFSETLIPYLNMGVIFILLPLCLAVGKIRKKI